MDRSARHALTKELSLEASYRILKFTTGSEHLHYGLFESDIPRDFQHLKAAQDRYLERLVELLPAGARTILDVGAGSGKTAEALIDKGFEVECVSPEHGLAKLAESRLGGRAKIHRGRFEDTDIAGRYDLVLFSESFQYVPAAKALERSIALLNPGGHILVSDFFSRAPRPKSPIRGGHDYEKWCSLYRRFPLDLVCERDVTAETAPLHDIAQLAAREVVGPIYQNGRAAIRARWPMVSRIGEWVFRKDLEKFAKSRLSTDRDGAEFIRAKIYKVYLFRLCSSPA